jgi:hypothetical protein
MSLPTPRRASARLTYPVVFVAAMVVGVMAYEGTLAYTPLVLGLLVLAVGLDRYGSAG